jgi:hypothetical protein
MKHDQAQLSERITNAEDWLARARRQLEQGETARGTLTLLLAEAEVHHAREIGMGAAPVRAPLPRVHAAIGMLTVVALAAAIWASGIQPATAPQSTADASSTTIVRLSDGHGSLLELVQASAVADAKIDENQGLPVKVRVVRVPVRSIMTPPILSAAPVLAISRPPVRLEPEPVPVIAAAPVPPSPPADAPASAAAKPGSPPVVSDANLIDLVLAAERSLRRANQ